RHAPEEYCLNNDNMANNELKITMKSAQIRKKNNRRRVGPELFAKINSSSPTDSYDDNEVIFGQSPSFRK
ncbi:MAG TPA: hypothetical protein VLH56_01360, partial [Dissulfurispiraceae bacterium]|nr:hypothetical protein [Dissulfurispiraceae bacterium]